MHVSGGYSQMKPCFLVIHPQEFNMMHALAYTQFLVGQGLVAGAPKGNSSTKGQYTAEWVLNA